MIEAVGATRQGYGVAAMALRPCVCTNRPPEALTECLAALDGQGAGEGALVVASGVPADQVPALRRFVSHALPGAEVLHEPRPGLSLARNRALRACEDGDVLAFLDDDAVAAPNWWAAMRRAWQEAEPRVAVIGGPIRPRFPDGVRPAWLTDALLPALTVLDYGPDGFELDPERQTVYGANIAFRCGPLRAAGGFDPAYGHSGTRVWFSEEDEAQRALHARGHAIRYVPDAAVWHVIPAERISPAAIARRRFRYGATLGARRARPRGFALKTAVRAAAGVVPALLLRDRPKAVERAVRAAENAGVLLAPLVARR
jgi:GT2 family glycosyltransferase